MTIKEFIYPNGVYSNIRSNQNTIAKNFPVIYESIKDNYHTKLYMLLHEIEEIPTCKNPSCNNLVLLKSISKGFRTYCSNACIAKHQSIDKEFKNKISKTKLAQSNLSEKYDDLDLITDKNKNYVVIRDYCKHGDVTLYKNTFVQLFESKTNLCQQCKDEIIENYMPSEEEIRTFQDKFDEFYKAHRFKMNESWFKRNFYKEYVIILQYSKHIVDTTLSEKIYLFKNNLSERPLCKSCGINHTHFNHSSGRYTYFCSSAACIGELELYEYLKSLDTTCVHKFYLKGKEFDIAIPDKKFIIEYNGLYWHGEQVQTNKNYHYERWKVCADNGFTLITIWEDDWENKKELVKSMLRNSLMLNEIKVFARNTEIRTVSFEDSKIFLNDNHIQGNCVSTFRYGLYHDNELISLMTFGKRKISGKENFELLRFCSKQNMNVVGGASKLFSHFLKIHSPEKILSYANLDISNGSLYDILKFKLIGHTGVNYWWVFNKTRNHRSNFMKFKLIEQGFDFSKSEDEIMRDRGYFKLFGLGNLKYEYIE